MEAMSEHPRVTYDDGGHPVSVDTSRVVFLLVSDIGAEGVNTAVLKFRNRSDVLPVSWLDSVCCSVDVVHIAAFVKPSSLFDRW